MPHLKFRSRAYRSEIHINASQISFIFRLILFYLIWNRKKEEKKTLTTDFNLLKLKWYFS